MILKFLKNKKITTYLTHTEKEKLKKVEVLVDSFIENQNYDKVIEFAKNGYILDENQTKKLCMSILVYKESVAEYRLNFNQHKWLEMIKELRHYDKQFFNACLNYISIIVKDYHNGIVALSPSTAPKMLKPWVWGNAKEEVAFCSSFIQCFQTEFSEHNNVEDLEKMKISLNHIGNNANNSKKIKKEVAHLMDIFSSMINEKINLQCEKENILEEVKSLYYKNKEYTIRTNVKELIDEKLNNVHLLTVSQNELNEINQTIKCINLNLLTEMDKLEFNNLVNEKLPQLLKNYYDIDEMYRDAPLLGETANTILENSLRKLKIILLNIKKKQEQTQLYEQMNDLQVGHAYLKAKA